MGKAAAQNGAERYDAVRREATPGSARWCKAAQGGARRRKAAVAIPGGMGAQGGTARTKGAGGAHRALWDGVGLRGAAHGKAGRRKAGQRMARRSNKKQGGLKRGQVAQREAKRRGAARGVVRRDGAQGANRREARHRAARYIGLPWVACGSAGRNEAALDSNAERHGNARESDDGTTNVRDSGQKYKSRATICAMPQTGNRGQARNDTRSAGCHRKAQEARRRAGKTWGGAGRGNRACKMWGGAKRRRDDASGVQDGGVGQCVLIRRGDARRGQPSAQQYKATH